MKWRKSPARAAAEGQARQLPLALQPLKNGYLALAPRERNMVLAAATVVALAVLWWVLLAPALGTLKRVNSERAELDAQWQHMLSLQHEAQALQAQPKPSPEAARQALEASVSAQFGDAAKLQWAGDRANVTLTSVGGASISQWLARARADAKAVPVQVRLTRSPSDTVLWNGLISLGLPQP
jgi:general secretion pathway protein M